MSIGNITVLAEGSFGNRGSTRFGCAANTTVINPGEPVAKTLGNSTGNVVTAAATNFPVVGTDYLAGVATSTSTQTASVAGVVDVMKVGTDMIFVIAPKVAATWDTQAEYDALVGARVLLDLTTGVYTILASDSANNGCVVQPLDISKYPSKVAFTFRGGSSYLA